MEIGAIIGGVVGGIITVAGYFFITRWLNRKAKERESRREEKDKLRRHFRDLKNEVRESIIPIISALTNSYGKIKITELSQPSNSFTTHFPKEATEWVEYQKKIIEHNKGCEQFCLKIRHDFELREVLMVNIQSELTPCIYDTIFRPLFKWWQDRSQRKANPSPNFKQIEINIPNHGPFNLLAAGWGSEAIAHAETESDKESCKRVIDEVAQNIEYERKAAKILDSADKLIEELRAFKGQLTDKLDDIDKFWPGTEEYKFKKIRNCPKCKQIFD